MVVARDRMGACWPGSFGVLMSKEEAFCSLTMTFLVLADRESGEAGGEYIG